MRLFSRTNKKLNRPKPFFLKKKDRDDDISILVVTADGSPLAEDWYSLPEIFIRSLGERSISARLTGAEARKLADWFNNYAKWADGETINKGEK